MSTANTFKNLRAWAKTSSLGILVPGSVQFRKNRPVGPNWHELTLDYCCNGTGDSFIVFSNKVAAGANITAISFPGFTWTGTLGNGGSLVVPIPRGYDETVSITVDTPAGRTITTATTQGTGVISAIGAITLATNTFTTSATPNSQYTVVLT